MARQINILLVENEPAAARLTKEALREAGLTNGLFCIPDGDDAIAYLKAEQKHVNRPYPDVIFLDLHLPRKSGLQVLAELKSTPGLQVIPVVIISGSADPGEVRKAYELHAACYIRKPNDLDEFLFFMRVCFEFWGSVVSLPAAS